LASVVTEHMLLLVPMMMVIMIFPMVAGFVTNYNNEQRLLVVEQAGAKLGGAIQQVYLVASADNVKDCIMTQDNPLPPSIEDQQYVITGTQEGEILTLHIGLPGINLWYDHKITVGQNAVWDLNSRLDSNSANTGIIARKQSGKIYLSFG
jgi:hypothetical protein